MKIKITQRKKSEATVDQGAKKWLVNFGLALSLSFTTGVFSDDTEIFFPTENFPANIFFVIDLSGSMDDPAEAGLSRLQSMQQAVTKWLPTAEAVNVGVFKYSGNSTRLGMVSEVVPVADGNNVGELIGLVNSLSAKGGTPTVDALWYADQYFRGELRDDFDGGSGDIFPSPIVNECQQNHVVLLTDGSPYKNQLQDKIEDEIFPNNSGSCLQANVGSRTDNGTCGAELTEYMNSSDSKIITHTIGFHAEIPWLQSLSTAGQGMHFTANDTDALSEAFNSILSGISSSFAAPTVSLNSYNESRHSDKLYYSQFQPYSNIRWDGNVKKYRINDEGVIVDSRGTDNEGLPLLVNGSIDVSSRSFWSQNSPDGGEVKAGGFAGNLPTPQDRKWYTDYGVTPGNDGMITPWRITADNTNIDWVKWALGADVEDINEDGDVSDNHFYVADALHNSPLLLSYSAATDELSQSEVLYTATNMGMLHAINADTGEELWAYSPEEHRVTHTKYFENEVTKDHVYGLDGSFTMHSTLKLNPSAENNYEVDKAWLYMTERRGGNRVYALDVSRGNQAVDPFKVMWKITGGDIGEPYDVDADNNGVPERNSFADLAQTWAKPQMITVQYGCATQCVSRDLLMFGGGYNDDPAVYEDRNFDFDGFTPPDTGHGNAVYLVDPETGELVWSVGNGSYHSLNLPMNHSVPSTPVPVDTDLDGHVNMLFFPDIAGNIWRVDLDQAGAASGNTLHSSGGQIAALAPAGENLRFFTPLDMARSGGSVGSAYFNLVLGSGMRSSPLFIEPDVNKLFSIKDRWIFSAPPYDVDTQKTNYSYVKSTTGGEDKIITASDLLNIDDTNSSVTDEYGFYMPLESGEKVLEPTFIHRNSVFIATYMPPPSDAQVGCKAPIGTTRLYIRDLPGGGNRLNENLGDPYFTVGIGIIGAPQLIDTGGQGAPLVLAGEQAHSVEELFAEGASPVVFRKMNRTGWVERDGYDYEDVEKKYDDGN